MGLTLSQRLNAHGRREFAKERMKQRIIEGVYRYNRELKKSAESPEKAYDRAMRGI